MCLDRAPSEKEEVVFSLGTLKRNSKLHAEKKVERVDS